MVVRQCEKVCLGCISETVKCSKLILGRYAGHILTLVYYPI